MNEEQIKELKSLINYNPFTGVFTWKPRHRELFKNTSAFKMWNKRYAGNVAGHQHKTTGYINIRYKNRAITAHRLAMLMFNKASPAMIDHINCIKTDNRIENLRAVNSSQNSHNVLVSKSNRSGYKGVSFDANTKKWKVSAKKNGKSHHGGYHDSPTDAALAYDELARHLYRDYAKTNSDLGLL